MNSVQTSDFVQYDSLAPWVRYLRSDLCNNPLKLCDAELAALGRVVPLLICGEQSAVTVFSSAAKAGTRERTLRDAFLQISHEETGHEVAWQTLFEYLPQPTDLHRLKRRAALFFARLGRAQNATEHFAQIAHLDSAVGAIMWHLERSNIARDPRIATLARSIKRDEARHVAISRRYARASGVDREAYVGLGESVRANLVTLLTPNADALDAIGIDADQLFKRIDRRIDKNQSL